MSFTSDLTEIMDRLQQLLQKTGPVSDLTIKTYRAPRGATRGIITSVHVGGITGKEIKNSNVWVIEMDLKAQIAKRVKSLATSEQAKRKNAEELLKQADAKRVDRDTLKLLDPPPLVSLALQADE